jgi:hypothetical protein
VGNLTTTQKLVVLAIAWLLLSGGSIGGGGKPTSATYVYEKDQGGVPSAVMSGINKLNVERKIIANPFERDTKNGNQQIPAQYKIAVEAAKELPSLVVQAGDRVLKIVKSPKTEDDVLKGVP